MRVHTNLRFVNRLRVRAPPSVFVSKSEAFYERKIFWFYKNHAIIKVSSVYKINKIRRKPKIPCKAELYMGSSSKNILKIISKVEKTVNKKQLITSSSNILLSISGGQDSTFLLFCFSFLQTQIALKFKIIWCNHFWQISSFYTTLHLTKSARAFSSPVIGFLPFQLDSSPFFYQSVITKYKTNQSFEKAFHTKLRFVTPSVFVSTCINVCKYRCLLVFNRLPSYAQIYDLYHLLTYKSTICSPYKASHTNQRFVRKASPEAIKSPICKRSFVYLYWFTNLRFVNEALYGCDDNKSTICNTSIYNCIRRKTLYTHVRTHKHENYFAKKINQGTTKFKGYKKFIEKISETRARNWRHITTERACTFYASNKCVYGHNLSDRVETILFNLIRGAGSRGIKSLPWKQRHSNFCYNRFYPSLDQVMKRTHINSI